MTFDFLPERFRMAGMMPHKSVHRYAEIKMSHHPAPGAVARDARPP